MHLIVIIDKPIPAVVTLSRPGGGGRVASLTSFSEPLIRFDHCKCELTSHKLLRLLGLSEEAGPYVLMAGVVPVGSFGFDHQAEPWDHVPEPWDHVHVPGHGHQQGAFSLAVRAFQVAITYYPKSNDPSDIREDGRLGYRLAIAEGRRDIQRYERIIK